MADDQNYPVFVAETPAWAESFLARTDRGTDIDADIYHASFDDDRKWEVTCKVAGWLYGTKRDSDEPVCQPSQLGQIGDLLEMMAEQADAVGA